MVLLIDNYDSFSYNLYQQAAGLAGEVRVVRNDALTVFQIAALKPSHILLSPGPGYPKDAGICEQVVRELGEAVPILGVCLGHQAICEAFGGRIVHAKRLMHGKKSRIQIEQTDALFSGLAREIDVARYHSLVGEQESLPDCLRVSARDENGEIMAVRHKSRLVFGVQFHPESILTPQGDVMMKNFLQLGGRAQ